ncbi:aminotransferase class III-fold pyridoxal phosphate-dependent enzyme [Chelatococcus reniformis]|uniref:Aspartate aminotransferase family protein n=1 Tax=Chelatococcus reniformis TaxID=1494448 RepID=A0A916X9H4_9HYPH|nr:aminotransferase class III-fold pyridoxal phosphate-dependent enzyme [Chelatococcus reniformis]GGC53540.1 aspartate aminotransferase family protein [Chelatococcus reniformis]
MKRLLSTGLNAGSETVVSVLGGKGSYFELDDGRRVLDGSNSAGALGHGHPEIVAAIREAAAYPAVSEGWSWREREKAAEDLIDVAFGGEHDWVGAVRFGLSGSEVNDLALSLGQALTGRAAIATRERAYHGLTGLARDVTVQPHWHGGLSRMDGGVSRAAAGAPVRVLSAPAGSLYGERVVELPDDSPEAMRAKLADVSSVIIDYTQGGIYHDGAYQDRVAAAARAAGALWIADEVVTGAGRSGRWFAFQGGESRPDMVTMGKALAGGGAPIGAVILSRELVERLDRTSWQAYSTFRGHPIAMAAVRAYLRIIARDKLLERVARLGARVGERLVAIAQAHPSVARVDGRGFHWTVELHGPHWKDWRADTAAEPVASRVAARALARDVVIGTSGEETSLFLAPSLLMEEAELELLLDVLDDALGVADEEFARRAG